MQISWRVDARRRGRCECFLSLTLVWLDASTRSVWTELYEESTIILGNPDHLLTQYISGRVYPKSPISKISLIPLAVWAQFIRQSNKNSHLQTFSGVQIVWRSDSFDITIQLDEPYKITSISLGYLQKFADLPIGAIKTEERRRTPVGSLVDPDPI